MKSTNNLQESHSADFNVKDDWGWLFAMNMKTDHATVYLEPHICDYVCVTSADC